MATTAVTTYGSYLMFNDGWVGNVNYARLYTSADVLVDTQIITMSHTAGTTTMQPSADIVFDVDAGTSNVSYVVIGKYTAPIGEFPALYDDSYTRVFTSTYDFETDGTLTIDTFSITVSSAYLSADGRDELYTNGFEVITSAKLTTALSAELNTQSTSFTANSSAGKLTPDANIVFDVAEGTEATAAKYIELYKSSTLLYTRELATTYTFATAGTLTVTGWEMSI